MPDRGEQERKLRRLANDVIGFRHLLEIEQGSASPVQRIKWDAMAQASAESLAVAVVEMLDGGEAGNDRD